jgi:hypothetical protein
MDQDAETPGLEHPLQVDHYRELLLRVTWINGLRLMSDLQFVSHNRA